MTNNYEEMKKEYLLKLEYSKVKPKKHDAYLAMKECDMMYDAYNKYRAIIALRLLYNDSEEYTRKYLENLADELLELSTLMAGKLIEGFFDFNYSDEKNYSFTEDEIKDLLLKQHFHKNSKDGLAYKISLINREIIDNTKLIYSSDLDSLDSSREILTSFKNNMTKLFKSLDSF